MRIDDYRYYGYLCRIFGISLVVIGILLPLLTATYYTMWLGYTYYDHPHVRQGITLAAFGIVLIVLSSILFREYNFRKAETQARPLAPPTGYCPYCGTGREEDATYCENCGKKLH